MVEYLKKHKIEILIWVGLIAAFLFTRLINLTLIPVFTDEAIYLRWSQIVANDPALRYMPLVDGKPPLFMWLTAILLKALPQVDILATGRLVSVGAGLGSLIGIFFASWVLFKNKVISYLSVFLYIFLPITLFYDRFGLADSLLTMFGIWSFGLAVILFKKPRLDVALILGGTVGLGMLTKSPAIFYLLLTPLFIFLFDFKNKNWKLNLAKVAGSLVLVAVISQAIFSVLRLFPLFHMIGQKNSEFIISYSAFLKEPFAIFPSTAQTLARWEIQYLTFTLAIFLLVSIVLGLKYKLRETLVLAGYFVAFFVAMASFNKVIFPRYLLILAPVLIMLIAMGGFLVSQKIKNKAILIAGGILIILPAFFTDYKLLTDPVNAPIADGDSNQYLSAWPAGYGVVEIRDYLKGVAAQNKKITVGTEGTFGLMPYSLEIYQDQYPNLEIKAYWPMPDMIPVELQTAANDHPTYFIVYQRQDIPPLWHVKLIKEFRQGNGTDKLRLYEIPSK